MIRAVIFDFDGVILESSDLKTGAFGYLFKDEAPEKFAEIISYHRANAGISRFVKFRHIVENILGGEYTPELKDKLASEFARYVAENIEDIPFVAGAREFLEKNHGQYDFYVASGAEAGELRKIIDARGIGLFFREVHGGDRSKNEIITRIMSAHGLMKKEVLFVGDAVSDMLAAEDCGLPYFAARLDGTNNELEKCRYRIQDLTGLAKLIAEIDSQ